MCKFKPRCALEVVDSSEIRLPKIEEIIADCQLGIHDISFMKLDRKTKLARLNMAFELGLFLASKWFGSGKQRTKNALVLDKDRYRYRAAFSDIAGQDIACHRGRPEQAIQEIRNWFDSSRSTRKKSLHGGDYIVKMFRDFTRDLPAASRKEHLNPKKLSYADVCRAMEGWLKKNGYKIK
jgi:hypothetical protein